MEKLIRVQKLFTHTSQYGKGLLLLSLLGLTFVLHSSPSWMTLSIGFGTDRSLAIYENQAQPPRMKMTHGWGCSKISSDSDVNSRGISTKVINRASKIRTLTGFKCQSLPHRCALTWSSWKMCQVHSYPEAPALILDSRKNRTGSGSFSGSVESEYYSPASHPSVC